MSIGGLPGLSGYDFSGLVASLVDAYRIPEQQMTEKQTKLETRKNAWMDVNSRLSNLDSKLNTLKNSATWTATQATSSNTNFLTVSSSADAVPGLYNVVVNQTAQAQTVVTGIQFVSSATDPTSVSAGSFSITVKGITKTITVNENDSLSTIASNINNENAGVNASVVQVKDQSTGNIGYQLAITNKDSGTENAALFADVTGGILNALGILDDTGNLKDATLNPSGGGKTLSARDSSLTVNGIPNITSSSNTITSAIPGVTLNLLNADVNTTVTVNVTRDYSVAQKAVQDFVDQYNSTMSFISDKLSYDSTTKKAGDLFGDSMLQSIQSRLRGMISNEFSSPGTYKYLNKVGLKTSDANFGKDGILVFDTSTFNDALTKDPKSVANLFGASYSGETITDDKLDKTLDPSKHQGLGNYMHAYLDVLQKSGGTIPELQNSLNDQISDIKDQIENFEERAKAYEERMRLKFAALESTLSEISSQNSWLMGQINAMNASSSTKNS